MSDAYMQILVNLGLTSTVIDILETSQGLSDAASNAQGSSEIFRAISQNAPLVLKILRSCKKGQEQICREFTETADDSRRSEIEDANKAFEPLILACREDAKRLQEKSEKDGPDGSFANITVGPVEITRGRAPRKEREAKGLMIDILEKLQLVLNTQFFAHGKEQQEESKRELATAISQLSELSSLEDQTQYTYIGSGPQNSHIGNQNTFSSGGSGCNYNGDFSFGTSRFDA